MIHFAALAYVGESVNEPLRYYDNNTAGSVSLLDRDGRAGVNRIVFSSTCATYGEPTQDQMPITETLPQQPINPYGWSKLMTERALMDYAHSKPRPGKLRLRGTALLQRRRAPTPPAPIGEDHEPETHIIPVVLNCALGKVDKISIFGDDYDTPDGTCIRDYIHVEDLVDAHVTVLDRAQRRRPALLQPGHGHRHDGDADRRGRPQGHGPPDPRRGRPPPARATPPPCTPTPRRSSASWAGQAQRTDITQMVEDAWGWFKDTPRRVRGLTRVASCLGHITAQSPVL